MITEVACCTQFLGNAADVAKMGGKDLGDAVHFPFSQPFGAQLVKSDASSSSSSGPKGNATTADVAMQLGSVKEENSEKFTASIVSINARDANFP